MVMAIRSPEPGLDRPIRPPNVRFDTGFKRLALLQQL